MGCWSEQQLVPPVTGGERRLCTGLPLHQLLWTGAATFCHHLFLRVVLHQSLAVASWLLVGDHWDESRGTLTCTALKPAAAGCACRPARRPPAALFLNWALPQLVSLRHCRQPPHRGQHRPAGGTACKTGPKLTDRPPGMRGQPEAGRGTRVMGTCRTAATKGRGAAARLSRLSFVKGNNDRATESQTGGGWKGAPGIISSNPLLK